MPIDRPRRRPCRRAGDPAADQPRQRRGRAAIPARPGHAHRRRPRGRRRLLPGWHQLVRRAHLPLPARTASTCSTRPPRPATWRRASCPTRQLGIVLDGVVESAPEVQQPFFQRDQITITGNFNQSRAEDVALVLRFGALPLEFGDPTDPESGSRVRTVSATLGQDSLDAGHRRRHRGPGAGGAVHDRLLPPARPGGHALARPVGHDALDRARLPVRDPEPHVDPGRHRGPDRVDRYVAGLERRVLRAPQRGHRQRADAALVSGPFVPGRVPHDLLRQPGLAHRRGHPVVPHHRLGPRLRTHARFGVDPRPHRHVLLPPARRPSDGPGPDTWWTGPASTDFLHQVEGDAS